MSAKSPPLLKIDQLGLRYPGSADPALSAVSMEIGKGELIALVGESGSGKSTLLRALTGLEDPFTGTVILNGRKLYGNGINVPPGDRHIGLVFQDYSLFPHMTIADNIAYGLKKGQDQSAIVRSSLELVGLQAYEKRYPHELSGGEQQRVALARALAPQPDILLMDEPFSNLDEALKNRLREDLFTILKQTGTTAILVTHDLKDAMRVADRIAILQQGRLCQIGTPKQLYQQPADLYVGRFFGPINLLEAHSNGNGSVATEIGTLPIELDEGRYQLLIRPESWLVVKEATEEVIRGQLTQVHYLGNYSELTIKIGQELIRVDVQSGDFEMEEEVGIRLKKEAVYSVISQK